MKKSVTRTKVGEKDPYDITGVTWANLETRFRELVDFMDTPVAGVNVLEARETHRKKVSAAILSLLDRAQEEARLLLTHGNGMGALEAGVQILALRESFFGKNSVHLIPAYLHMARTKQFLERYGEAEDMLSLAQYVLLAHQNEVDASLKAELHQTFGLLYAADDKLDAAVKHMTCATYYLSSLHGPEHILTTFSYFDLANVFASKSSMESAMSLYDTVKEIWYRYLIVVLEEMFQEKEEAKKYKKYEEGDESQHGIHATAQAFGLENLADTSKMLYGILNIQQERFRVTHPSPTRAEFVLGLFLLWVDDTEEATKHLLVARRESQRFYGPRHPVVEEIEQWCTKFDIAWQDDAGDAGDAGPRGGDQDGGAADPYGVDAGEDVDLDAAADEESATVDDNAANDV